jgi:hypothetical protein
MSLFRQACRLSQSYNEDVLWKKNPAFALWFHSIYWVLLSTVLGLFEFQNIIEY